VNTITISATSLGALYVAFVIKHFVADFLLQTSWMVAGKEQCRGWLTPLAAHAGIHAALTLLLMLVLQPSLWWLSLVDFIVHGATDYGKATATRKLGLTDKDNARWWLLGLDQAVHDLTHFSFILALLLT
jgi:hypothetical protein